MPTFVSKKARKVFFYHLSSFFFFFKRSQHITMNRMNKWEFVMIPFLHTSMIVCHIIAESVYVWVKNVNLAIFYDYYTLFYSNNRFMKVIRQTLSFIRWKSINFYLPQKKKALKLFLLLFKTFLFLYSSWFCNELAD